MPCIGLFHARYDPQQRRFAGAVRPKQPGALPGIDHKRDVFQDDLGAIALGNVYDLEQLQSYVVTTAYPVQTV